MMSPAAIKRAMQLSTLAARLTSIFLGVAQRPG
jgi:hypothetical protein